MKRRRSTNNGRSLMQEGEQDFGMICQEPLEEEMVMEARAEEMLEFRKHQVYVKVPIAMCLER